MTWPHIGGQRNRGKDPPPEASEMGNYHCEVQRDKVWKELHGKGRSEETPKTSHP